MKVLKDNRGNLMIEVNQNNFIVYVKNANFEGFSLKYLVGDTFYYQHLMLGVRAGAKTYFKQAKVLYNHIKKAKLTNTSFRRLAV